MMSYWNIAQHQKKEEVTELYKETLKKFIFDNVFGPQSHQTEVYKRTTAPRYRFLPLFKVPYSPHSTFFMLAGILPTINLLNSSEVTLKSKRASNIILICLLTLLSRIFHSNIKETSLFHSKFNTFLHLA